MAKVLKLIPRMSERMSYKHPTIGRLYLDLFEKHGVTKDFEGVSAVRRTI